MFGWYFAHNVWNTEYNLTTEKNIKDLRVVMFADSHIGTTFGGEEFAKHLEEIQSQNPDIVVVVGDYVDDGTTRENMIIATKNLGKIKTKYGTYFVFGNHDKGYYGSKRRGFNVNNLIKELTDNGIMVLKDESILIDDSFYIIGRQDHSMIQERIGSRMSMAELIKGLDKNKYMIVLDHQPTDFKNQADSGVDLVLSGHTHGGHLFPFNQVGKWIGANDLVYGHEKRKNTDFIVTSGISDWAIKFKTGTKSEFVTINIRKEQ
jgi:predicted MPP superfamily phosphohydrolase